MKTALTEMNIFDVTGKAGLSKILLAAEIACQVYELSLSLSRMTH